MFTSKKVEKVEKRVKEIEDVLIRKKEEHLGSEIDGKVEQEDYDKLLKRVVSIEDQLKPEPAFKKGDMVNFFLIGNEFEGEIVEPIYKYENSGGGGFFSFPTKTDIIESWRIAYLDKNEVVQTVAIKEEDIWFDEECPITDLYDQLEELRYQVELLKGNKNSNKK